MGRKVFVSYKHKDSDVKQLKGYLSNGYCTIARDYVDYLSDNTLKDDVYKGEGDEDLSDFKNDTIKNRLKDKIHDSSVTLVLISPNMKEDFNQEADQWMPWEISYSLKEITRNDQMSHTNGVLAVVLPDRNGNYSYYISQCDKNDSCNTRNLAIDTLFQILRNNMFNYKYNDNETYEYACKNCNSVISYGKSSYIESIKWCDFISNKDYYLDRTVGIRDDRKSYNIIKEV